MKCPNCGSEVDEVEEKNTMCPNCGMWVKMAKKPPWWGGDEVVGGDN